MTGKEIEAARQNGSLVPEKLERANQALGPFGQRNRVKQPMYALRWESLEQSDSAGKTLIEAQLPAHRGFGNARHAFAGPHHLCQLVDHFALNKSGIHIEREQAPIATEDAFPLEGDVDREFLRRRKKSGAHRKFPGG